MDLHDIAFWVLLSALVAYIVLKVSGFIQSPLFLEISPFVLTALLIIVIRGEIRKDINVAIGPLKETIGNLKETINNLSNRLSKLEGMVETILHLNKEKKVE